MVDFPLGWQWNAEAKIAIFFGLIAALLLAVAYFKGFFNLPKENEEPPLNLLHVLFGFLVYLGLAILISEIDHLWIRPTDDISSKISIVGLMNFFNQSACLLVFFLFFKFAQPKTGRYIWKTGTFPYKFDIVIGLATWIIAFPLVIFFNEAFEILLEVVFHVRELPEQTAIQYVKMAMEEPGNLVMAIFSIVVLVPIVEEFLFRGLLQSWFKKWLGPKAAILVSSLCFSLFHFSGAQGVSNFSILASLFILALFLGFIYERQRSLITPITLHSIFNLISIINLIFLKESAI